LLRDTAPCYVDFDAPAMQRIKYGNFVAHDMIWSEVVRKEMDAALYIWPTRHPHLMDEYKKLYEDLEKKNRKSSVIEEGPETRLNCAISLAKPPEYSDEVMRASVLNVPPCGTFKPGRRHPETIYQGYGWPLSHSSGEYQTRMFDIQRVARARGDILNNLKWPKNFEGTYR